MPPKILLDYTQRIGLNIIYLLLKTKLIEYWIRRCDVNGAGILVMQEATG